MRTWIYLLQGKPVASCSTDIEVAILRKKIEKASSENEREMAKRRYEEIRWNMLSMRDMMMRIVNVAITGMPQIGDAVLHDKVALTE